MNIFLPHADPLLHYYGDTVRKFFLAAGLILLLAILRDREFLSFYLFVGVFAVLVLTILAGLTNPRTRQIILTDGVVCAALFLLFEYLAVGAYVATQSFSNEIFLLRQLLALIFLIALYFSTKTYRGLFLDLPSP
jgi:hypothetical protein